MEQHTTHNTTHNTQAHFYNSTEQYTSTPHTTPHNTQHTAPHTANPSMGPSWVKLRQWVVEVHGGVPKRGGACPPLAQKIGEQHLFQGADL